MDLQAGDQVRAGVLAQQGHKAIEPSDSDTDVTVGIIPVASKLGELRQGAGEGENYPTTQLMEDTEGEQSQQAKESNHEVTAGPSAEGPLIQTADDAAQQLSTPPPPRPAAPSITPEESSHYLSNLKEFIEGLGKILVQRQQLRLADVLEDLSTSWVF